MQIDLKTLETQGIRTDVEEQAQEIEAQAIPKTPRYVRMNHPKDQIIGDKNRGVQTRRRVVED